MPRSYMQMIFIDSDDLARHTNVGAAMDSNKATWAAFNSYRHLEVERDQATFLLDYYNAKGDLSDTIRLDATGFSAVTGEKPKTEAAYHRIDANYWCRAARVAAKRAKAGSDV